MWIITTISTSYNMDWIQEMWVDIPPAPRGPSWSVNHILYGRVNGTKVVLASNEDRNVIDQIHEDILIANGEGKKLIRLNPQDNQ